MLIAKLNNFLCKLWPQTRHIGQKLAACRIYLDANLIHAAHHAVVEPVLQAPLIYIVLVLLFKDFTQPVTILGALVLSIPGAFLALFLTRTAMSMPSMIGIVMLMGIATKNSILLVEYAIVSRRERGMTRHEALLDACRKRVRPIVMTTLAMGAGMLPVALEWGASDGSFRSPMAIVVIGGLITSTLLSLLVIPVLYTHVDDGVNWLRRRIGKEPR